MFLAGLAVLGAVAAAFPRLRTPGHTGVLATAAYAGALIVLLLRGQSEGLAWRRLLGRWPTRHELPLLGVIVPLALITVASAYIVFVPLSYVAPGMVERVLKDSSLFDATTPGQFAWAFFAFVVAAPVTEEILFRGFLLHRWAHRWGTSAGVVLSAVMFAVGHSEWVGHFLTGIVLALLYLRTQSLWVPILAHALNNAMAALPAAWQLYTHQPDTPTTLAEFRDGLGWGVVAFVAGAALLGMYKHLYWPDGIASKVFRGPVPYDVPSEGDVSTSVS